MSSVDDDFDTHRYRRSSTTSASAPPRGELPPGLLRGLLTGAIMGFLFLFAWAAFQDLLFALLVLGIAVAVIIWLQGGKARGVGFYPGVVAGFIIAVVILFLPI
jgi:hypothetical protein